MDTWRADCTSVGDYPVFRFIERGVQGVDGSHGTFDIVEFLLGPAACYEHERPSLQTHVERRKLGVKTGLDLIGELGFVFCQISHDGARMV